jgi:hypothetical protein
LTGIPEPGQYRSDQKYGQAVKPAQENFETESQIRSAGFD